MAPGETRSSLPGLVLAGVICVYPLGLRAQDPSAALLDPSDPVWSVHAPEEFDVLFQTSAGDFTVAVERAWAPLGADRFYNLVRNGYYDDARFHRTVPDFIVQFGLAGDPAVSQTWQQQFIADDPVVETNTRGRIAFAFTEPATRSTQVYISTVDNSRLDAGGFAPFGQVTNGMEVVDLIYSGYGEDSGGGVRRGDQSRIVAEGNDYLDIAFPELTHLIRATISRPATAPGAGIDTVAVTQWIESMMGPAQFPAAAIVVVDAFGPIYQRTFGASGTDEALTLDSRFYLGSSARAMIAQAVMQLVGEGLIELDSPVNKYLPDLRFSDPTRGDRLTVAHLLHDSSGLPAIAAFNRRVRRTGKIDHIRFVADPGAEVEDSNLNSQLLGAVIEEVSGISYPEFMDERVFGPAGMMNTTAERVGAEAGELIESHNYFFGWPIDRDEASYPARAIPVGYLVSTPSDIGRYLQRYLGGEAAGAAGIAWSFRERSGTEVWTDARMAPGSYLALAILPDQGLGVAVLTNRNAGPVMAAPSDLLNGVVQVVRGETPDPYFPWERAFRFVLLLLILRGIFVCTRVFRAWMSLGRPQAVAHTTSVGRRLVFDLTVVAVLPLWVILGLTKLPIQALFEFYPDIGVALTLFPLLAIPSAVFRALVKSEAWRRATFSTPGS